MKKIFEKHGLFKVLSIALFVVALLTWLIPSGSFDGTSVVIDKVTPVGLTDLFTYSYLSFYHFSAIVIFLLVLGGFYGVLSVTKGYNALVDKIAKFVKGRELIFTVVVSLLFAVVASISSEIYHLFLFAPFVISIIRRAKMDKITAFCVTFGSILVGIFGATFSSAIVGNMLSVFSVEYTDVMYYKIGMFVFAFLALNLFNCLHISNGKKAEEQDELFVVEEVSGKARMWPIITVFAILLVLQILAFIDWNGSFAVTTFTEFNTWLNDIKIGDVNIVSRIFGTLTEFGQWHLFILSMVVAFFGTIGALLSKTKLNDVIEGALDGARKMLKPLIIVMMIYSICVLSVLFPVIPTITDWIINLADGVKLFLSGIASFVASILSVEMRYVLVNAGSIIASTGVTGTSLALVTQATYGLVQFFAPTSVILMFGLSYLDISYKKYFKNMWKFILVLLAGVIVLTTLLIVL